LPTGLARTPISSLFGAGFEFRLFIKEIPMKIAKKQVRIIKKIREASGIWRFISLQRVGSRYVWDDRHGYYFLDWREGRVRKREYAGSTPAEATEAQRRKRNELLGAMLSQGKTAPAAESESLLTLARAREMFLDHVRSHSPDKPETARRYEQVLNLSLAKIPIFSKH